MSTPEIFCVEQLLTPPLPSPDNRVDLAFQKHVLLSIPPGEAEIIARSLGQWLKLWLRDSPMSAESYFSVTDLGN
jgi:hypothetical protein